MRTQGETGGWSPNPVIHPQDNQLVEKKERVLSFTQLLWVLVPSWQLVDGALHGQGAQMYSWQVGGAGGLSQREPQMLQLLRTSIYRLLSSC